MSEWFLKLMNAVVSGELNIGLYIARGCADWRELDSTEGQTCCQ